MTAEEFWQGDPKLAESYREAYKIQKERKNQELWLQGLYFLKALGCALHGSEEAPYPDEPLAISEADREAQAERERQNADAAFEAVMMNFASGINSKFKQKGEADNG